MGMILIFISLAVFAEAFKITENEQVYRCPTCGGMDCIITLEEVCTKEDNAKIPKDLANLIIQTEDAHYMCLSFGYLESGRIVQHRQCVLTGSDNLCEKFEANKDVSNCTLEAPASDVSTSTTEFITGTSKNEEKPPLPDVSTTVTEFITRTSQDEDESSVPDVPTAIPDISNVTSQTYTSSPIESDILPASCIVYSSCTVCYALTLFVCTLAAVVCSMYVFYFKRLDRHCSGCNCYVLQGKQANEKPNKL